MLRVGEKLVGTANILSGRVTAPVPLKHDICDGSGQEELRCQPRHWPLGGYLTPHTSRIYLETMLALVPAYSYVATGRHPGSFSYHS